MKYKREIKVAVLAIICGVLLYFGFHFLKGVNIFSPSQELVGMFSQIEGLSKQAPVRVRGYKVGQVSSITYDFTRDPAFTVHVSIKPDIILPAGTEMVLVADGLMGGKAVSLVIPTGELAAAYSDGDTLPCRIEPGLVESMQTGLLQHLDSAICDIDSLVLSVHNQLEGDHIKQTLEQLDRITADLTVSAQDIRRMTHQQLPVLMTNIDHTVSDIDSVAANLREADLQATVARVNLALDSVNGILNSKQGTLGLLLHDGGLYRHIDSTILSVDSLVVDLKANPKRYVHFSLFGSKDKKKKK